MVTLPLKILLAQLNIADEFQMKPYFMVFLKAGATRGQDSITVAKIQQGHLNNIERLMNEKKWFLQGRFLTKERTKGYSSLMLIQKKKSDSFWKQILLLKQAGLLMKFIPGMVRVIL